MITETICPGACVIHLDNGTDIYSEMVKYTQVDGRQFLKTDDVATRISMMSGKVWFGPTRYFAHDPDGTVRRCDPMAEFIAAQPKKKRTWLQRIFA